VGKCVDDTRHEKEKKHKKKKLVLFALAIIVSGFVRNEENPNYIGSKFYFLKVPIHQAPALVLRCQEKQIIY